MGVLLQVVAMPLGAVVGGVSGGIQGTSKAEIEEAERVLATAFAQLDFQAAVCQEVRDAGRRNTHRAFMLAGEHEGTTVTGPGSILEVTVVSAGLAGSGEKDAPLEMFLRVQARLLKSLGEPPLYSNTWVQTSGARPFKEWAAGDGGAFRKELPAASRAVAESIVDEIFLAFRPGKS